MAEIIVRAGALSNTRRAEINAAVQRARAMSTAVWSAWRAIFNQKGTLKKKERRRSEAWKGSSAFREWFGDRWLTNPQFRKVNNRLTKIHKTLEKQDKIKILYHGKKGRCCTSSAWNGGFRRRRIHLCEGFFAYDAQEQASTIVHEMVHATGITQWGHPGGDSLNSAKCRKRASETPRKARRNAYNFERLFMAFDPGA